MLFNSWQFLVFLPVVFVLYWALPHRCRWIVLLLSSCYFYMSWNAKYIILILVTTVISYFAARAIEKGKNKKAALAVSLFSCLGILFCFKYFNFAFEILNDIVSPFSIRLHPVTVKFILPVGISFYTFQTLSYVIDVYRGKASAERHFGYYAAFISFFPQLVAGPIERTEHLLTQIKQEHCFDHNRAILGCKLILWGFFKKLVVADTLAPYVDKVYGDLRRFEGFSLILAALFFTIQIYCDFSGYSDIARGVSRLFGIELMENFNAPYFAASVKEFWSRWHISLSTWFRDYVYIPMGGNRQGNVKKYFNLMVTFLVSGLWHGANWTYVAWGGLHGGAQIVEDAVFGKDYSKSSKAKFVKRILVFLFVSFAWVFFRAGSIGDAVYVFTNMFDGIGNPASYLWGGFAKINFGKLKVLVYGLVAFLPLIAYDFVQYKSGEQGYLFFERKGKIPSWIFWVAIGCIIIFFTPKDTPAEFVYFQF